MVRAVILCCDRIRDKLCVACEKCFKAIAEKAGEFGRFDEIDVVAWGNCGGCPGFIVPKMKLINDIAKNLERDYDVVFLATCMVTATKTGNCPLDLDEVALMIKDKFGKKVISGTHPW